MTYWTILWNNPRECFLTRLEIEPRCSLYHPASLILSYWNLQLPCELQISHILHLTHFTIPQTAHCKLELSVSKGLKGWDSIWLGHKNNTASLISQQHFTETNPIHLQGLTVMNCNLARPHDSFPQRKENPHKVYQPVKIYGLNRIDWSPSKHP